MAKITVHVKEVNIKSLVSNDKAVRITLDCVNVIGEFPQILNITEIPAEEAVICEITRVF